MNNIFSLIISLLFLTSLLVSCRGNDNTKLNGINTGNLTEAKIKLYKERIIKDPKSYIDHNKLAQLYLQQARETGDTVYFQKAEEVLKKSLEIYPDNYTALVYTGMVAISKHEFKTAFEYGDKARKLKPKSAYAYAVIGDAYKELGDINEAEIAYATLVKLNPSLDAYSRISNLKIIKGDIKGAIEAMKIAYDYGINQGSPKENIAWTQIMIGSIYFNSGRLHEAETHYYIALDMIDDYYLALEHIAEINAVRGNYEKSVELYKKVLETNPKPEYYLGFASVLEKSGNKNQSVENKQTARKLLEKYVENGDNGYLRALAQFYADEEIELDKALILALKDFEIRKDPISFDTLAWIYYKKSDYDKALQYSDKALKYGSKNAEIFYHSGIINYKFGDLPRARKYLEKALNTNPYFDSDATRNAEQVLSSINTELRSVLNSVTSGNSINN